MGEILIEDAPESLDSDALRSKMDTEGCGSIVSFLGITRGIDDGIEVHHLEFDAVDRCDYSRGTQTNCFPLRSSNWSA